MQETPDDAARSGAAARAVGDDARVAQQERTQLPEPGEEVAQEPPLVTEGADVVQDDPREPGTEHSPRTERSPR